MANYDELLAAFKKGLRNGNWRRLSGLEKALYRASLWYTKYVGNITNKAIIEKLFPIIEKFKETRGMRIFKRGFKKAIELLERDELLGVLSWAPEYKHWLRDHDYIFWLGTVR